MGEGETPDTQASFWAPLTQFRHGIHTYEVSMKARPKGHIAIKLYKVEESHPTTTTKNSFPDATLLRFVIIVLIIAKT